MTAPRAEPTAVRAQNLPLGDRVIALAGVVPARSDDNSFSSRDLRELLLDLAIPHPANLSAPLNQARISGYVIEIGRVGATIRWKMTPVGQRHSEQLLSEVDRMELLASAGTASAPELGGLPHPTLRPQFAPPALHDRIVDFLRAHPFDQNVFGMTRFPDGDTDPLADAIELTRKACKDHGLELHLASDRALSDDLWENVSGHMWASRYGIALFENRADRDLNYNVTIEVGAMLMAGRRCALLKDTTVAALPTDFVGRIYKDVDLSSSDGITIAVHSWIRDDLALGGCTTCPSQDRRPRALT